MNNVNLTPAAFQKKSHQEIIEIDLVPAGTSRRLFDWFSVAAFPKNWQKKGTVDFSIYAFSLEQAKNAVRRHLGKSEKDLPDSEIRVAEKISRKMYA